MMPKNVYVTQPSLAPLDEFVSYLQRIWESGVVTHNGPFLQQLETEVNAKTGLQDSVVVGNGTIALQLAIKALEIQGEIITTPFSWIATTSAIQWEGCQPVFVDVNEETFNMDPGKIETAITPRTKAIMPVHVFSNPVDTVRIEEIARRHNLFVIYDAAHAFGITHHGKSILSYGDVSCTSFHATKIFNSGEGGACFAHDKQLTAKLRQLRFFGHNDKMEIAGDGLNGKMTEIHAALGLANLPYLDSVIEKRKQIYELYHSLLAETNIQFQRFDNGAYNYSYMPIVFETEKLLKNTIHNLLSENIVPRRYFYPSLNTIIALTSLSPMPASESLARRILCLPSFNTLSVSVIEKTCAIIMKSL